jgi:hypothetical protein
MRRWLSAITALVVLSVSGCTPPAADHFGVHILRSLPQRFDVAAEIGVHWVRSHPSIIVQDPRTDAADHRRAALDGIAQWRARGYKVHVTVRRNGHAQGTGQVPSTPPPGYMLGQGPGQPAFDAYKKELASILDSARPDAIAIENEEDSLNFWDGGSGPLAEQMQPYVDLLAAAVQVAAPRGVIVTDGGITTPGAQYVTYQSYLDQGRPDLAASYAARTAGTNYDTSSSTYRGRLAKARFVLSHAAAAGARFANFHWYAINAEAFEETIAALRRSSGLRVISNEIGRVSDEPGEIRGLASKVLATGMPWAIWFSIDAQRARALQDDGTDRPGYPAGNLRPRGVALRDFLRSQPATADRIRDSLPSAHARR